MNFEKEKKEIIFWAKLLNERGFVTARSGNISRKVADDKIVCDGIEYNIFDK